MKSNAINSGFQASVRQEDIFYRSHDDLLLYAKAYGNEDAPFRPVVCLPGLTRNGRDFHELAVTLAAHPTNPRRVYCLDLRGRGRSQWDEDWQNYSVDVELMDVLTFLTLKGLTGAAFIGTSRGGIVSMLLAVAQPSALNCLVLNDIGPVIETAGLARIMAYAGKIPVPREWDEAKRVVQDINKRQFPEIDDAGWTKIARQLFNEADGKPAASYDPNIGKSLSEIDISKPVPDMWAHFDALKETPVLVVRGENSDILSPKTVQEMQSRNRNVSQVTIQNEGHAPFLNDGFSQRIVADFLCRADAAWTPAKPSPPPNHKEIFTV